MPGTGQLGDGGLQRSQRQERGTHCIWRHSVQLGGALGVCLWMAHQAEMSFINFLTEAFTSPQESANRHVGLEPCSQQMQEPFLRMPK